LGHHAPHWRDRIDEPLEKQNVPPLKGGTWQIL
jgi:hypothetical protein